MSRHTSQFRSSLAFVVAAAMICGCSDATDTAQDQEEPAVGVQALYPGPVSRPGGAYTPLFLGNPADTDTLCNFVRNRTMTTITRVESYDPWSSVDVTFNIVRGTPGDDILVGTDGPDLICGYEGNDTLRAGKGDDIVIGGQGSDLIFGACGQDFLWGGAGADTIYGETGTNNVCGTTMSATSPSVRAPAFWDIIYGGDGSDFLYGEWGIDAIFGGDFYVDNASDTIGCGASQYGGTAYILHPSTGSGWIEDSVTGCDEVKRVQ